MALLIPVSVKFSHPQTFKIPKEDMLYVIKARWLSSSFVSLKLSSTMLIALMTGYSDSPPCILAIFKTVSPVQFSTISQNVDQVVLAPDKSIDWKRQGLHLTA